MSFKESSEALSKLESVLNSIIKGKQATIKFILAALLADGHVLIEDYPGSGKTTLCKALGKLIARGASPTTPDHIASFKRIQFTPDMLPGDVLGVNIFNPHNGKFYFSHGPIFAQIVLADEINRAGPKVQAAFLECMAEKQVTIENVSHPLDDLFFVVGTQNPLDIAGTYPLPQVQLDRFILKLPMSYVDFETESEILKDHDQIQSSLVELTPVIGRDQVLAARRLAKSITISEVLRSAIVELVQSTRTNPNIQYGASTRAALMLQAVVRAWAMLVDRDYATEDDLKMVAPYVLMHRLKFYGGVNEAKEEFAKMLNNAMEKLIKA
ncbi:MAG TPA: MoxR family ATPase [Oligoflexia bacterium]|nr:MoxR family ATPase [Oligoflexia bacterium]HMP27026.1 MoxR family ATPase [Oligoflexia bacterium]